MIGYIPSGTAGIARIESLKCSENESKKPIFVLTARVESPYSYRGLTLTKVVPLHAVDAVTEWDQLERLVYLLKLIDPTAMDVNEPYISDAMLSIEKSRPLVGFRIYGLDGIQLGKRQIIEITGRADYVNV
jgi:hypothetical protein